MLAMSAGKCIAIVAEALAFATGEGQHFAGTALKTNNR
jgi:uncharacterized protein YoaH (UPF0181 family)